MLSKFIFRYKPTVLLSAFLRPYSKFSFLGKLPRNAKVLDVGCGNNSSYFIKTKFPNFNYTGIDICDHNHTLGILADQYIITTPENFDKEILNYKNQFDAIISHHNLEHCNDRVATLNAMCLALKPGGRIYIAFPTLASVHFPNRKGTLNYFDDPTHKDLPPNFDIVLSTLTDHGIAIEAQVRSYKPPIYRLIGFLLEPISRLKKSVLKGTWELYGFESVIWGRKLS